MHKLLATDTEVRLCSNPQVTKQQLEHLRDVKVLLANGFEERLAARQKLKIITVSQPSLDASSTSASLPLAAPDMRQLQKQQVKAAISKGGFTVNAELDEEFNAFLKQLNPAYEPPTRRVVESLRDELNQERLETRDTIMKAMGPGGIVSDGCRGKLHESMLNFLFVEGLTGTCLYWRTVDMGGRTKDGEELAKLVLEIKTEMESVCGPNKVRTYTTDRASANKVALGQRSHEHILRTHLSTRSARNEIDTGSWRFKWFV